MWPPGMRRQAQGSAVMSTAADRRHFAAQDHCVLAADGWSSAASAWSRVTSGCTGANDTARGAAPGKRRAVNRGTAKAATLSPDMRGAPGVPGISPGGSGASLPQLRLAALARARNLPGFPFRLSLQSRFTFRIRFPWNTLKLARSRGRRAGEGPGQQGLASLISGSGAYVTLLARHRARKVAGRPVLPRVSS